MQGQAINFSTPNAIRTFSLQQDAPATFFPLQLFFVQATSPEAENEQDGMHEIIQSLMQKIHQQDQQIDLLMKKTSLLEEKGKHLLEFIKSTRAPTSVPTPSETQVRHTNKQAVLYKKSLSDYDVTVGHI
jgi:hypothetical protein